MHSKSDYFAQQEDYRFNLRTFTAENAIALKSEAQNLRCIGNGLTLSRFYLAVLVGFMFMCWPESACKSYPLVHVHINVSLISHTAGGCKRHFGSAFHEAALRCTSIDLHQSMVQQ